MRRLAFVPLLLAVSACGEMPRTVHKVSLDGQAPASADIPTAPAAPKEPPAPDSAAASSPAWLRAQSPIEWTAPSGWDAEMSTKPQRMVEFTLLKNGPGRTPVQFIIFNGIDDHPGAREKNLEIWQTKFREDQKMDRVVNDHDGVTITRMRVHGHYDFPAMGEYSDAISEDNWTMIFGSAVGPTGSIMFRVQGPDAIIQSNQAKIDQILGSMKPRPQK